MRAHLESWFKQSLYYYYHSNKKAPALTRAGSPTTTATTTLLVVAHIGIVERGDHRFDHGLEKQALARGRLPVLRELLLVEHELPAHEVTIRHRAHASKTWRKRADECACVAFLVHAARRPTLVQDLDQERLERLHGLARCPELHDDRALVFVGLANRERALTVLKQAKRCLERLARLPQ
jgi:hypothetical protein